MIILDKSRNTVDKLVAASTSSTADMLRARRDKHSPPVRLLRASTANFMRKHPKAWKGLYNWFMLEPGYSFLSSGSEHTVVVKDGRVLKIDRRSQTMDESDKQTRLRNRRKHLEVAQHYLGHFLMPQSLAIAVAPFRHKPRAVITEQELLRPVIPDVAHETSQEVQRELVMHHVPLGRVAENLTDFLYRSHTMLKQEGLLPDVGGLGNIAVMGTGEVMLVDSYPTDPDFRLRPSIVEGFDTIDEEHQAVIERLEDLCANMEPGKVLT